MVSDLVIPRPPRLAATGESSHHRPLEYWIPDSLASLGFGNDKERGDYCAIASTTVFVRGSTMIA